MSSRVRILALAPTEGAQRGWLGLSLSILCFLHCVGAPALVALLPAAFAFVTENEAVEWALLGLSAALAARPCWGAARGRQLLRVLWTGATGVGVVSLLSEQETLLRVCLGSLALMQLWCVLAGSRRCLA